MRWFRCTLLSFVSQLDAMLLDSRKESSNRDRSGCWCESGGWKKRQDIGDLSRTSASASYCNLSKGQNEEYTNSSRILMLPEDNFAVIWLGRGWIEEKSCKAKTPSQARLLCYLIRKRHILLLSMQLIYPRLTNLDLKLSFHTISLFYAGHCTTSIIPCVPNSLAL